MYFKKYIKNKEENSKSKQPELIKKVESYLSRLLIKFQHQMDKRYSYTFFDLIMGILSFRDRINGLLLSELGGYVNGPKHAPAGTKRISNFLRKANWESSDIGEELYQQCKDRMMEPKESGRWWLMTWDDSVLEKPESWFSEGLCPVRSSKAGRLTRIKRGYYRPPLKGQICVPGYQWSAGVLTALGQTPQIFQMEWWTTRGRHKEHPKNAFYRMLHQAARLQKETQATLWHVLDRGYANATTLDWMLELKQQFIIRWKSNQLLYNQQGVLKNTYKHSLGQKVMRYEKVWDKERKQHRNIGIIYRKVAHPDFPNQPLYLIIIRAKRKGQPPMYLLTNVRIDSIGMAKSILFAYIKRWDIEQTFRFGKTAMAMEAPRLWRFENRIKLLMIVTLAFSFLLQFFRKYKQDARKIINTWCPRTGKWQDRVALPLYRLRLAICQLILYDIIPKT